MFPFFSPPFLFVMDLFMRMKKSLNEFIAFFFVPWPHRGGAEETGGGCQRLEVGAVRSSFQPDGVTAHGRMTSSRTAHFV